MTATDELQHLCAEGGSYARIKYLRNKIKRATIAELRKLLRERGVRFNEFKFMTQWTDALGESVEAYPTDTFPDTLLVKHVCLTPAQAIDATLGDVPHLPYFWTADGTLHIELPRLPESISVRLPSQRDREVSSARVWQYTRGSGTCHMEYCDEWSGNELYPTEAYVCSECGYITVDGKPNHCPNCGRKVMDE